MLLNQQNGQQDGKQYWNDIFIGNHFIRRIF